MGLRQLPWEKHPANAVVRGKIRLLGTTEGVRGTTRLRRWENHPNVIDIKKEKVRETYNFILLAPEKWRREGEGLPLECQDG